MNDEPKTWGELTDAEKGALLLAHHEGKTIEYCVMTPGKLWEWGSIRHPNWLGEKAYRVRPEPVRETVTLYGPIKGIFSWQRAEDIDTYTLTYNIVDGEIDCASVRMERIK